MWILPTVLFGYLFVKMLILGQYVTFLLVYGIFGLAIWGNQRLLLYRTSFWKVMLFWYPGIFFPRLLK
jgi:hypothetical protein